MKVLYSLAFLVLLSSCNEKSKDENTNADTVSQKKATNQVVESAKDYKSDIRPNEKLKLEQVYTDTAEFVEFNNEGDYAYVAIKKDNKTIALTTNETIDSLYKRGDIIDVKWKIDSVFIAGEGEKLDFTEWLVSAKKVKDGPVSLFRKKYKKPIKFYWGEEDHYSTDYKDYLYTQVEYYLANSKKDLVKSTIQDPNASLIYSIEDRNLGGHSYTVLGISNEFENRTSIIQWLYLDSENRNLYEYDLANEKLIEFK
ncbi:hypothetical protein EV144_101241 [Flavobacterium sp. 270]|uniref:hypothetical protein n=1 Tax=Flavobacterium sp. 270 TaxID=2512114 RepID=UPI001066122A|nr:hypothetical protein [Flavobacterium sp. 270]TDW51566.1 hypothetical protein EV144_101241 [Flavobacterium sp. 270]